MYWIALIALCGASICDWRRREIPDSISVALLVATLGAKLLGWHPLGWTELGLGALIAFAGGAALFALGGLGGGDVKLLTALGAVLGAKAFVPFVMLTAVLGGAAALLARRRREKEIAYAPVMLAGFLGLLPLVWLGS